MIILCTHTHTKQLYIFTPSDKRNEFPWGTPEQQGSCRSNRVQLIGSVFSPGVEAHLGNVCFNFQINSTCSKFHMGIFVCLMRFSFENGTTTNVCCILHERKFLLNIIIYSCYFETVEVTKDLDSPTRVKYLRKETKKLRNLCYFMH